MTDKAPDGEHHCHHSAGGAEAGAACHDESSSFDWLLWGSIALIVPLYLLAYSGIAADILPVWLTRLAASAEELLNTMAWGLVAAVVFVGLLTRVPRDAVMSVLGSGGTVGGIARATTAGVALDLCSHGILAVGMSLYERGASIGQVIAFLLASPWNSFSLTMILWALIGLPWTLAFIALSAVIAIIAGVIFDHLVARGTLPTNPNTEAIDGDFHFKAWFSGAIRGWRPSPGFFLDVIRQGLLGSRMVMRWLLFGVLLASLVRILMEPAHFQEWFGASLAGLAATMVAATIIEVCSEGSVPIASDLFNRAGAPGNAFAFLMAGVSTDYTEVMSIQNTTRSWKIALFLPLITLPQVVAIAALMNLAGS